ncbi:MAG: 50S ribosome-binding GTPase [Proteobacteria bacterium]|nr:50S ribosome-binding GTPase [Pseudomonadota bacterium]
MSLDSLSGSAETTTANEELVDLIQRWQKENIDRDIVVVVAGKGGAGKSTLINNFLTLDRDRAAKTGLQPTSVTKDVKEYKGEVNGIPIRAIDMPGLHAQDHSEDTPAEIVATLIHLTNRKADILIYCIPLHQRMDLVDKKNIHTLNKAFGEIIWENAIVAFTHADYILEKQKAGKVNYDQLLSDFREELQILLRRVGVLARVISLHAVASDETTANSTATPTPPVTSADPFTIVGVPTGEEPNKPSKWSQDLLTQIININLKNTSSMIMHLNGIQWKEVADSLKEEKLHAEYVNRAHKYASIVGTGVGIILGGFLGIAIAKHIPSSFQINQTATLGGLLGQIGGRGVAALCIIVREMNRPQNQACAKDIAFYIKVNKRLKELRDKLQE